MASLGRIGEQVGLRLPVASFDDVPFSGDG
jgi:hypothetical protein